MRKCSNCGARPSAAPRTALRERLVASSSEFRELEGLISSTRIVLLIIALGYLGYGAVVYVLIQQAENTNPDGDSIAYAILVRNFVLSVVFMVCWRAARSAPAAAIAAATSLWLLVQIAAVYVLSIGLFVGVWVKAVTLILLVRGLVAGVKADQFLRRLRKALA